MSRKKQIIEALGAVFIGLIFLSTYLVRGQIGGTGGGSGTTTTTIMPATVYSYGFANALVANYTNNLQLSVSCAGNNTSTVLNRLNSLVSGLQVNNSVINSYNIGDSITVQTGGMGPEALYSYVYAKMNQSALSCVDFQGTADLLLPASLNFTYATSTGTQHVSIPLSFAQRNVQFPLSLNYGANTLRVKVVGLIESNGTIYQLNITRNGA